MKQSKEWAYLTKYKLHLVINFYIRLIISRKKLELLPKHFFFTVATGFPSGLYSLVTRLTEIKLAIADGATEIDVVLDRSLILMGQWDVMYEEVKQMRAACKGAHLKVILGVGELGTYENVCTKKAITVPIY